MRALFLLNLVFLSSIVACGPSEEEIKAAELERQKKLAVKGEAFFEKVIDDGYACVDCHPNTTGKSKGYRIYSGHSLVNASKRGDFWLDRIRGKNESVLNAALYCYARFQVLELEDLELKYADSLDGIDPSGLLPDSTKESLDAFLKLLPSAETSPNMVYSFPYDRDDKKGMKAYVEKISGMKADPEEGKLVFEQACSWCHGEDGMGISGKGQKIKLKANEKYVIIDNVRMGGYRMPFFQSDRISDQELASVAAYIMKLRSK